MQTQFVFRHMDSSQALRSYAEERLGKIKRYFSDPLKVAVTFSVEKIDHIVQFDVTLRNGLQLHASEKTENMYSSIDMALAKMERQVRRYKDRITSHKPHKGRAAKVRQAVLEMRNFEAVDEARRYEEEEQFEKEGAEVGPADDVESAFVIHSKEFKAERLSVEQAVMQMDLMHRAFLVFTNTETGDINVVYRLEDGNVGLLETRGHVEEE